MREEARGSSPGSTFLLALEMLLLPADAPAFPACLGRVREVPWLSGGAWPRFQRPQDKQAKERQG